jgi:hypothetical protein
MKNGVRFWERCGMGVLWGALYKTGMASRGGGRGETAVASGALLGWLRILPPPPYKNANLRANVPCMHISSKRTNNHLIL